MYQFKIYLGTVTWDQALQCDEGKRIRSIVQTNLGARNDWINFFAASIIWSPGTFFNDRDAVCGWLVKWKDENNN